jgi:N-carbamoylputrescine amidase
MIINLALLQLTSAGDDARVNAAKGAEWCRRARDLGADLALFPEMWSNGYIPCPPSPADRERWLASAQAADGEFVSGFRELARELGMAIAVTYLERWPGAPRNTMSLIDRHGEIVLTYAKVHTCDFDLEAALTPGDAFPVATLDTGKGDLRAGAMICFDREFPESARVLMLGGAELILVPNACELERHRLGQFHARAFENMTAMAMANYAAPQENGHSIALNGIAFVGPENADGNSVNMTIVEAGGDEGIYMAAFDIDAIREYRSREAMGNAYRKPSAYAALTSPDVQPPFVRPDARR